MILSLLLTSLGFLFAHRIFGSSLFKVGLSNLHQRAFLLLSAVMLFLFMQFRQKPEVLWVFFGTIFILLKLLPHFFSYYQDYLIQSHMIRILDQIILNVQAGQTLRASLVNVSRGESSLLRVSLENLVHALAYENSSASLQSKPLKGLFHELSRIEKSQSKSAEQLRALRRNYKTIHDFRRRSGQVTLQIRMQAGVSALLYVGLLLFMITQFGFSEHRSLILISSALFFLGMVTVFVIGRRLQWNT